VEWEKGRGQLTVSENESAGLTEMTLAKEGFSEIMITSRDTSPGKGVNMLIWGAETNGLDETAGNGLDETAGNGLDETAGKRIE
jgi:hypothetical protein